MTKKIVVCFDVEAVLDEKLRPKDMPKDQFPPPIMHKIVTISICVAKRKRTEVGDVIGAATVLTFRGNESEIIQQFSNLLTKYNPQLVGYNSRSYDMAVITQRAMINRISLPTYFQSGDKWNSYKQRYSQDWHLDLMDVMSNYRASCVTKLDVAATSVGLPGKYGPSGADVGGMYKAGRLDEIANYCETDVLNTYGLMLRWFLTTGELSEQGFEKSAQMFFKFIASKGADRKHIAEFGSLVDWEFFGGRPFIDKIFANGVPPELWNLPAADGPYSETGSVKAWLAQYGVNE